MKYEFNQAVILCGGEGSRLGNITKKTPKPLIKKNGKPFLEHQIEYLKKFGFTKFLLLCGYKSNDFIKKYEKYKNIDIITENKKLDTGGALMNALNFLDDNFLFYNGDTFADFNFKYFIDSLKKTNFKNSIAIKYHNLSNRYGKVKINNKSKLVSKISKNISSNYIFTGFSLLNKELIRNIKTEKKNFEDLILEKLIKQKKLHSFKINKKINFIDIGIKSDLKKGSEVLMQSLNRKVVFFDRDGTINKDINYLYKYSDLIWNKSAYKAIHYLNSKNILVFIITNQSGVGRGFYSEKDVLKIHSQMNKCLLDNNAYIDDFFYAMYYKYSKKFNFNNSDFKKRKPNIGMVLEARKKWKFDIKNSIIIGDNIVDELLAKNLKIRFYKVNYKTNLLNIVKKEFKD